MTTAGNNGFMGTSSDIISDGNLIVAGITGIPIVGTPTAQRQVLAYDTSGVLTWTSPAIGAGTLTVSTSNDATLANHTHSITSSAAPGAVASILSSDPNGTLSLASATTVGNVLSGANTLISLSSSAFQAAVSGDIALSGLGIGSSLTGGVAVLKATASAGAFTSIAQVTNLYGVYVSLTSLATTVAGVSNAYGLYITGPSGASYNNTYGIYQAQTSISNYFASATNFNAGLNIAGGTVYTAISSNPGAAAALLATDASGNITIQKLLTQNIEAIDSYYAGQFFAGWVTFRSRGTIASPSQTLSGDELMNINGRGYHNGGAYTGNVGRVFIYATENFTSTAQGTAVDVRAVVNGTTAEHTVATFQNGLQVGAPTGGDKGAGTANFAGDIYKNNSAYTNPAYVLEHWATGNIIQHADKAGALGYSRPTLSECETYIREHYELPGHQGKFGLFDGSEWLLEKVEELTTYVIELSHEIERLKGN